MPCGSTPPPLACPVLETSTARLPPQAAYGSACTTLAATGTVATSPAASVIRGNSEKSSMCLSRSFFRCQVHPCIYPRMGLRTQFRGRKGREGTLPSIEPNKARESRPPSWIFSLGVREPNDGSKRPAPRSSAQLSQPMPQVFKRIACFRLER